MSEGRNIKNDMQEEIIKWGTRSSNNERLRSMLTVAKPELLTTQEELDQQPWIFNCHNGAIDLKTAKLLPHCRENLITQISPVLFNAEAKATTWEKFLEDIFAGNIQLIRYVKRAVGYSLTGVTSEQILLFLHGEGANGKTTFTNVMLWIMGEYGQEAAPELLLEKSFLGGIPNDQARLRGVRYLAVAETSDGRRFDEGLVKRLTGGDKITARFLHGEYFEFLPTHKIWLSSNHKPVIRATDHAIWRRIKTIPFNVTFPPEQQDKGLAAKLQAEAEGILAWAVQGCLEWQKAGLEEPKEVTMATATYRAEMDVVENFIAACCDTGPDLCVASTSLYECFRDWAQRNGEATVSSHKFGKTLEAKGYVKQHRRDGNVRLGLQFSLHTIHEMDVKTPQG
jgi:putative DNA primase/helicase